MRTATRLVVLALVLGWAAGIPHVPLPGHPPGETPDLRQTIEPAPPLLIDLRTSVVERVGKGAWRSRLDVMLMAGPGIRNLALDLVLPEGMQTPADPLPARRPVSMRAGESVSYTLPLEMYRAGALPVQLRATYELEDGRVQRTLQGVTLQVDPPKSRGRHHAGAYEFMAVPLGELQAR